MKKLTVWFEDDTEVDLITICNHAIKLEMENVDGAGNLKSPKKKAFTKFVHPEGLTTRDVIMGEYKKNAEFKFGDMQKLIVEEGFSKSGINSPLKYLSDNGYIKKIDTGIYKFLKPLPK